jgi:trigger factor
LKTDIISQEKNITVVKAEFEAEEVQKAVDATYRNISSKANIKGFRKGHVPRKTLEMFFGKKGIYAETAETLSQQAIDKMIEDYELKLIAEPTVKPGEMEEGKPFEVTVTFEVTPEVTFPELDTVEAVKTVFKTTDKMVDENVARILDAYSEVVPTYEERAIEKKDIASVKYVSSVIKEDGSAESLEKEQKTEIDLNQEGIRPEVVDGLVGKKPGDKSTVEFKTGEHIVNKELAGKTVRYEMEILGIMKRVTPELTDAKVAEITKSKQKTVAEFKDEVRKQLDKSAEEHSTESLKDSALAKICDESEVELPATLINRQKEAIKREQAERIKRESGLEMDAFFEKNGMNKDDYETEVEGAAKKVVKQALVLEAIAEANDIEWTPEELNAEIQRIATASRIDIKKFQDYIYGDRDRLFEMAEKIRNRKALDFIITKVKVKEEEYQEPQAPAAEEKKDEAAKEAKKAE